MVLFLTYLYFRSQGSKYWTEMKIMIGRDYYVLASVLFAWEYDEIRSDVE
jgi:hypothetical protein